MSRKSKKEERLLELDMQQQFYMQEPPMFYGQVPGLIPVAAPSRQAIQLAPIIQPIAVVPYGTPQKQQQQPVQSQDEDDYDY